jgi:hypothetical protein
MQLKSAERKKVKIRMSLASPTGFGKTMGALLIAYGMTEDWSKIAVIDTENESASFYSDHTVPGANGLKIGKFQTLSLTPPFSPERYTEAIKICEDAGIEVIIIDSITHVWKGQGGLLESNNQLGGRYQDWAKTTPRYQRWLDGILQSKCHVITTNRKKQAYSMTQDGGKTKVEKQGMEDEIRDGYDYEMTVAFELVNDKHLANTSKDRTGLFMGTPEFVITPEVGKRILNWCNAGNDAPERNILAEIKACNDMLSLTAIWNSLNKEQKAEFKDAKDYVKTQIEQVQATI